MTASDVARFNVLLEDVQRTVKFLAEGHVVVVERLDAMSSDLQQLRTDVDDMRTSFDARLTRVGKALNGAVGSKASTKARCGSAMRSERK